MTIKKALTSIALGGALALGGCSGKTENNSSIPYQTIKGIPISVGESCVNLSGNLATVIDIDGKKLLGYTNYRYSNIKNFFSYLKDNTEATVLIQSEISDGDNEPIELIGTYVGNKFKIKTVKANGYQVDF
jgi:hypothetical protein